MNLLDIIFFDDFPCKSNPHSRIFTPRVSWSKSKNEIPLVETKMCRASPRPEQARGVAPVSP
jgi:hypothetical protein